MSTLDFSSLEKALMQLHASDAVAREALEKGSPHAEQLRAGAIQAFEYSFELCLKFIQRVLQEFPTTKEEVMFLSYPDLMRAAAYRGLLPDPALWVSHRKLRNQTSHTYDRTIAETVFKEIPEFLKDAQSLLDRMKHAV